MRIIKTDPENTSVVEESQLAIKFYTKENTKKENLP